MFAALFVNKVGKMNCASGIMQGSLTPLFRPRLVQITCKFSSLRQSSSTVVRAQKPRGNAKTLLGNLQKAAFVGSGSLFASAPAWAEDAFTSASEAVLDTPVEITTGPAADDPVITVMFTIAIGALVVVTLGVS